MFKRVKLNSRNILEVLILFLSVSKDKINILGFSFIQIDTVQFTYSRNQLICRVTPAFISGFLPIYPNYTMKK